MTLIDITKFGGIVKKLDPTQLPPENGQAGVDCRLDNGALRAWKGPLALPDLGVTPTGTTVAHPNRYVAFESGDEPDGTKSDVNGVNAPVANDAFKRLYFTGDSQILTEVSGDTETNLPKVTYDKWVKYVASPTNEADPPDHCFHMGIPAFDSAEDKPTPSPESIARGNIKTIDIYPHTPTKTLVTPDVGSTPILKSDLDTGDKVIIDFPGCPIGPFKVQRLYSGFIGGWDSATTYVTGDIVVIGSKAYVAEMTTFGSETNTNKNPTAAGTTWWSVLLSGTDYLDQVSAFYLTDFKVTRKNWQSLQVVSGQTYLRIECSGHGLNEGDKIVIKADWGGKIDEEKVGTVSEVESASKFKVTGLTGTAGATLKIGPDQGEPVGFWVLSKDGEDYYLGSDQTPAVSPDVYWGPADSPRITVYPQSDNGEPDYARRTWTREDLVEKLIDRKYVLTCVNLFGEEGGPSYPSDVISVVADQTDVTFNETGMVKPDDWEKHGLMYWRLYRTDNLGQFRYVADIMFPETKTAADLVPWDAGDFYVAGDVVEDDGKYYRSLQGSSGISDIPDDDPAWATAPANHNNDPATSPNYWAEVKPLPFTDSLSDTQLAEPLPTQGYLPPPDQLRGLISIPGGILAGFSGSKGGQRKEVCFSVPYQCHAWPLANRLSVDYEVMALAATQAGVVVATKGKPYIIVGDEPGNMSVVKLEVAYACRSAKSMVDMGSYAMYASPAGLVAVGGNTPQLVTSNILTREQWQAYNPDNIVGGHYDGKYFGFCPSRTDGLSEWSSATRYEQGEVVKKGELETPPTAAVAYISLQPGNINHSPLEANSTWWAKAPLGFIFNPETGEWMDLSTPYSKTNNHLINDRLYTVDATGAVFHWNAGTTYKPFTWTSAILLAPRPANFGAAQVVVDDYGSGEVKVKFFFDGVLKHTQRVAGAYVAATAYQPGDTVMGSDGKIYRALVATTGNAPPGSQWLWIADGSEPFRLPSGFYVQAAWVTVEYGKFGESSPQTPGPISIRRIAFAESVGELKQAAS